MAALKKNKGTGQCYRCSRQAEISLKGSHPFCKKCFSEIMERRVRKELKKAIGKSAGTVVCADEFSAFLIKKAMPRLSVKTRGRGMRVEPMFAEDSAEEILNYFLRGKKPLVKKGLRPFEGITAEEAAAYAGIHRISFSRKKPSAVSHFLELRPGLAVNAAKACKKIRELLG